MDTDCQIATQDNSYKLRVPIIRYTRTCFQMTQYNYFSSYVTYNYNEGDIRQHQMVH